MKNKYSFLSVLLVLSSLMTACSFVDIKAETKLQCPDANKTSNGITISLKNSMQDILYVNIYRQDVTGFSDPTKSTFPVENIGLVFPVNNNSTFIYEDNYVFVGKTYRYYARIYDKVEGYMNTEWTEVIKPDNGLTNSLIKTVVYSPASGTQIKYYSAERKMQICGTIYNPTAITNFETEFSPAIVVKCGDKLQAIKVDSVANGEYIYLTNLIPVDFFNQDIQFVGIVGQKEEKVTVEKDKQKVRSVIWTGITPIPLIDEQNMAIKDNIISLKLQYGDSGYDYSTTAN